MVPIYCPSRTFGGTRLLSALTGHTEIDVARSRLSTLELTNVEFFQADFLSADRWLSGGFGLRCGETGVFSWVPHDVRDALLELCAQKLRPGGLLYLNYNTRPGWNMRGLVREFLIAQTGSEWPWHRTTPPGRRSQSRLGVDWRWSTLLAYRTAGRRVSIRL